MTTLHNLSLKNPETISNGSDSIKILNVEEAIRPKGFRFVKHIINITAEINNRKFVVCGEDDSMELAKAKVTSELCERAALIYSCENRVIENSNGWAAHPILACAIQNSIYELCERDAVLTHWYSKYAFRPINPDEWPTEIKEWVANELSKSEFPILKILVSTEGLGPSVTVIFMNKDGFGVSAHATRETLLKSIKAAITECCRPAHASIRRDHWNASNKIKNGVSDPSNSDVHALYYAYQEPFPKWMFGKLASFDDVDFYWNSSINKIDMSGSEFSFTLIADKPIYVGFASHPKAFNLRWGITDSKWVENQPAWERLGIKLEELNLGVHIVS